MNWLTSTQPGETIETWRTFVKFGELISEIQLSGCRVCSASAGVFLQELNIERVFFLFFTESNGTL